MPPGLGDPERLRLSQGASLKAAESEGCFPVSFEGQSDFARVGRLTMLLPHFDLE